MSKKISFLSKSLNMLLILLMASPHSFASSSKITSTSNQTTQEQNVAQAVSQTGQTLQDNPTSQGAAALMGSVLSNVANQNIQEQLNRYGNARIQLNVDENFSLKNSQFDLLLPIWEEQENLFFTQGSFHRTDDRNQGNLGLGLRHFSDESMLGINSFFDYDLSRHHSRLGVGLEYWRNYLKLSSNGYIHLSGWKNSTDLANYEERAANGLDMRAEGFLPIYPQIGAKLMYEQYFGDEVALFDKDTREINPYAVTMGVNYTPVPLLTFNVDQRQGKSGQHDTRLGLQVNYQLGQSLDKQLSSDEVATMRSLAGSRYDFVERNNNIVLEYRKNDGIRLYMVDLVTGYSGEQKSLGVSISSKYGLRHIEWSAPSLLAAGGQLVDQGGGEYSVILPAHSSTTKSLNTYTVSGVAVDANGNRSERSETVVMVQPPMIDIQNSTFTPANSALTADGKSTQVLTITIKDGQGQAIDFDTSAINLSTSTLMSATVSPLNKTGTGVYEVTVMAGADDETVELIPTVNGARLSPAVVVITKAIASQANSLITTDKTGYVAGEEMKVTVTLKDAEDNGVTGVASQLTADAVKVRNTTVKSGNWSDNGDGSYSATYTAKIPGTALQATLMLSDWSSNVTSAAYSITPGLPSQTHSSITVDKASYAAGEEIKVTVTLKDAEGNGLTGESFQLTADAVTVGNTEVKSGSWTDNGDGSYSTIYTAKTPGTALQATLMLSGWSSHVTSAMYSITLGPSSQAHSSIKTDKGSYVAGEDIVVTVMLKDAEGNDVTGAASQLTTDTVKVPNTAVKSGNWADNGDGSYSSTYTAKTLGTALQATLTLNGWSSNVTSAAYSIMAGQPSQADSSITVDKTSYISGEDMLVTVTLSDAEGNGVTGVASQLAVGNVVIVNNSKMKSGNWVDNGDGSYSATYTARYSGSMLSAQLRWWEDYRTSKLYSITPGQPDRYTSSIKTDKTSYVAGEIMNITIMLKDAAGNELKNAASQLTADTVKVPNTTMTSNWSHHGSDSDGTYRAIYRAKTLGTALQATLMLSDWSDDATSVAYSIMPGQPSQTYSSITTDKTSYVAGEEMVVTVTLKDATDNGVTGAVSHLTADAVKVPNTVVKSGNWDDKGDGSYSATYTAKTPGTALQATLMLSDWSSNQTSAAYSIAEGVPSQENSSITIGKASYGAGENMMVTVTLKDAAGNLLKKVGVRGNQVTVPNAEQQSFFEWTNNNDGTYSAKTYKAKSLGTDLQATLRLNGWSSNVTSATYSITPGLPDRYKSSIKIDKTNYVAGEDMVVTVTLRDVEGYAVTGAASQLTADAVKVKYTEMKSGNWTDNGDGTYSATYMAKTAIYNNGGRASLTLSNWSQSQNSVGYSIAPGEPVQINSSIKTNALSYTIDRSIEVTVKLADIYNNNINNIPASEVESYVTIPKNMKLLQNWSIGSSNNYVATYVATISGNNLVSSVQMSGWSQSVQSPAFNISSGFPSSLNSSVKTDSTTYRVGDTITVEVTLKSQGGYPLPGEWSIDNSANKIKVDGAKMKSDSWTDNGDGTYTATYTAISASNYNQVKLNRMGFDQTVMSKTYIITP